MKIEFKNGSTIESISDVSDAKRSQRGEMQIARMSKQIQYWQHNPDKYIEFVTGVKLPWYRKIWIRLELMQKVIIAEVHMKKIDGLKLIHLKKIKDDLPEEIYCGELDGKHSEVCGDIEIQDEFQNDEDLAEAGDGACDGERLREKLIDIYEKHNLDFKTEEKEIEDFFNSIDRYVEVTVNIPLSKKEKLYEYAESLRQMKK